MVWESHIVAGLLKPRISKKQNVQESEKTFLFLQIMCIGVAMLTKDYVWLSIQYGMVEMQEK